MALTAKELAKVRSNAVHGALTVPEARKLLAHLDALEGLLTRLEATWRVRLGIAE